MLMPVTGKRFDPMLRDLDLPLAGMFFPGGFPLHVATNSRHVMDAARESWEHSTQEFDVQPLRLRVVIQPEGDLAVEPCFRQQGHLLSVVSDANNFASADLRDLFASIHLSERTAADHPWLRWFYVESMAYMLLAQRYVVPMHATCVARDVLGLLLSGPSGAG